MIHIFKKIRHILLVLHALHLYCVAPVNFICQCKLKFAHAQKGNILYNLILKRVLPNYEQWANLYQSCSRIIDEVLRIRSSGH